MYDGLMYDDIISRPDERTACWTAKQSKQSKQGAENKQTPIYAGNMGGGEGVLVWVRQNVDGLTF